jgi:dihydroneopterin aldolase
MTDYLSVRDLSVRAVIGVHAWERDVEQTLLVSVDMVPGTTDIRKAAASDDLADALDYSAVAETIAAVLREGRFRLIETAAERVAGRLLADFAVSWLRLELRKSIASAAYTAVITLERARENPLSRRGKAAPVPDPLLPWPPCWACGSARRLAPARDNDKVTIAGRTMPGLSDLGNDVGV